MKIIFTSNDQVKARFDYAGRSSSESITAESKIGTTLSACVVSKDGNLGYIDCTSLNPESKYILMAKSCVIEAGAPLCSLDTTLPFFSGNLT